jgi:prenyltransferase beta subunit
VKSFEPLKKQVLSFLKARHTGRTGEYTMCEEGEVTLYSSCFAAMTLHYLGELSSCGDATLRSWADYINSWQDPETGYFLGPEIISEELTSPKHDYEHIAMHLTAHALPVLDLLGARPAHPLEFAKDFLHLPYLREWLDRRDWTDAWLEGNNLLFVGQFLIHLRDVEQMEEGEAAIRFLLEWLNSRVDPRTGLWGTDGHCTPFVAMCGGYHQLLLYYHENEDVHHKEQLVDTVLSLQHPDGGFQPRGGGGACEDVDAVDILVNMYKRTLYRRTDTRIALRKAMRSILSCRMDDGGFVYRTGEPFVHMGIRKTRSPKDRSNLFATWFRVHTLALIGEVLTDHPVSRVGWKFNGRCSMGWHRPWNKETHVLSFRDRYGDLLRLGIARPRRLIGKLTHRISL